MAFSKDVIQILLIEVKCGSNVASIIVLDGNCRSTANLIQLNQESWSIIQMKIYDISLKFHDMKNQK